MSVFETKIIKKSTIYAPCGLSYSSKRGAWTHCRDLFADQYRNSTDKDIFVRPYFSKPKKVVIFLQKLESLINVKQRSKFYKADYMYRGRKRVQKKDDAFVIMPSEFWLKHRLRWSFLTAVISIAAEGFKKSNLRDIRKFLTNSKIAKKKKYFKNKYAIKRFLQGHTDIDFPEGDTGWGTTFKKLDKSEVDKVLR